MRFAVADTGAGIPREHLQHVFEKFYRVPGASGGSAGLGLSIAKEIVEAHGGEIGVESEVGRGIQVFCSVAMQRQATQLQT